MVLAQCLGRVADLALAGQEHQHVAPHGTSRAVAREFVDSIEDRLRRIFIARIVLVGFDRRPVARLDRIQAAGHLDHRRVVEERREALRVDRGRGDDHLQVGAPAHQPAQEAEQEVDVQAALVRLVDDQRVIGTQVSVMLELGEQDTVGHQLHMAVARELVREAHLVADHRAQWRVQFLRDTRGHAARRESARLGVADQALDAPAQLQAELGQLGRLAGTRFAADDDHRVIDDGARDLLAAGADGQRLGEFESRQRPQVRDHIEIIMIR